MRKPRVLASCKSTALQLEPGCGNDKHREDGRGHHSANHGRGNALHHFGASSMADHDGNETGEHDRNRHGFRPYTQHSAFTNRIEQCGLVKSPSLTSIHRRWHDLVFKLRPGLGNIAFEVEHLKLRIKLRATCRECIGKRA